MSLIEMSVTGSVMILCIAALRLLAGRWLPKWTFYALWVTAALRLLLSLSIPLPVSAEAGAVSAAQAVSEAVQARMEPAVDADAVRQAVSVGGDTAALQSVTPAQVLGMVWLAGSLLLGALCLYSYLRCMKRFRASLPDDTPEVRHWLEEHRLHRPLEVRTTDQITSPLTYGVLRPVILLPKHMDRRDSAALRYVLTHELVHVRRWDAVTKLLFAAALCVHWWNPLVWLLYLLANRDVELSCDEAVLRQFGSGAGPAYARTLLRMTEPGSVPLPFYNGFGKHAMKERIVAIMKFRRKSTFLTLAAVVLVVAAALFAVLVVRETQEQDPNQITETEASFTLNGVTYPQNPILQDFLDRGWEMAYVVEQEGDPPDAFTKPDILYDTGYRLESGEDHISVYLVESDVRNGVDAEECRVKCISVYGMNVESFCLSGQEMVGIQEAEMWETLGAPLSATDGTDTRPYTCTYAFPEQGIAESYFSFDRADSEVGQMMIYFDTGDTEES
ncbi:MAG: M56 family metallopeptidase [Clostridiales bacterium]|nr:M56 family metallopeptidase [Clostridiales bacterium]